MEKIELKDFIKLNKILDMKHINIYPLFKQFFQVTKEELRLLNLIISEASQVIIINKKTNELIDLVPINILVKVNFKYLKDAQVTTNRKVDEKYTFIIYENIEDLKNRAKKIEIKQKLIEDYFKFCEDINCGENCERIINFCLQIKND